MIFYFSGTPIYSRIPVYPMPWQNERGGWYSTFSAMAQNQGGGAGCTLPPRLPPLQAWWLDACKDPTSEFKSTTNLYFKCALLPLPYLSLHLILIIIPDEEDIEIEVGSNSLRPIKTNCDTRSLHTSSFFLLSCSIFSYPIRWYLIRVLKPWSWKPAQSHW